MADFATRRLRGRRRRRTTIAVTGRQRGDLDAARARPRARLPVAGRLVRRRAASRAAVRPLPVPGRRGRRRLRRPRAPLEHQPRLQSRRPAATGRERRSPRATGKLLGLASHEYFHSWNVKRIKPAAFVPYDLAREAYTRQLWAFEGITSYYDDLALRRSGVIDARSYLELLGRTITAVLRTPGRHRQSVAESSFDAWIKYYRQDENTPNAVVSYYAKGALSALALDLTLRDCGASLDALMRALWQRYGAAGDRRPRGRHCPPRLGPRRTRSRRVLRPPCGTAPRNCRSPTLLARRRDRAAAAGGRRRRRSRRQARPASPTRRRARLARRDHRAARRSRGSSTCSTAAPAERAGLAAGDVHRRRRRPARDRASRLERLARRRGTGETVQRARVPPRRTVDRGSSSWSRRRSTPAGSRSTRAPTCRHATAASPGWARTPLPG